MPHASVGETRPRLGVGLKADTTYSRSAWRRTLRTPGRPEDGHDVLLV